MATKRQLPDPIERLESRIEELCDLQFSGIPIGMIRCYDCQEIVPLSIVEPASDRPDAPAVCSFCLEKRYLEGNGQ